MRAVFWRPLAGDISLHSLTKFMVVGLCCLSLAACSTYGIEDEPRETVYSYNEPDIGMTYDQMAREMSGGSVQVYNLDGPAAPVTAPAVYSGHNTGGGVPYATDSNVTIYPFDDGGPLSWPEPSFLFSLLLYQPF